MQTRLTAIEKRKLKNLLLYRNDEILRKFQEENKMSRLQSMSIFKDLLRYLWLTQFAQKLNHANRGNSKYERLTISMFEDISILDEMWHTFILHTAAYEKFCNTYFSKRIEHYPASMTKKKPTRKEVEAVLNIYHNQKQLVKKLFGNSVYHRWYTEYPKLSLGRIKEKQLQVLKDNLKFVA